jgi:glycosyltransferase involved in cell wall biosynthesis
MKVAYLVNQYPKVSHSFIRREITALEARGVTVARFSVRAHDGLVDDADRAEAGRTEVLLGRGGTAVLARAAALALRRPRLFLRALATAWRLARRSDRGLLRHLAYLAEAAALCRRLEQLGVEHLHAHFGTNPATVALLCHVLGGPRFSFTVHGPEEFDRPLGIALGEKIARASFVVAVSSFGRSQLYRWCPYRDWPKIHVVRCAVEEQFLAAAVNDVPSTRRLVCVGRLCEQKGQAILVEAARRLAAAGTEFELVLVGDGEMRPEIEALIDRSGLRGRVRVTGWASGQDVLQHVQGARAVVLPSFGEGLPVVLMEALALCRPVITTSIAGIPELVRDAENGWLITPGDVDALVTAMRAALDGRPEDLARMGAAGRAVVADRHRAAVEAGKLAALFEAAAREDGSRLDA